MRFDHISPQEGLSQSVVQAIIQDDQGFMWIATQDGLNRYDGYNILVFKDDPDNPDDLQGNFITSIDKDSSGALWIGTNDGGLNRYHPQTGLFTKYTNEPEDPNSLSENSVTWVLVDRDGIVWAGTSNRGLNRLDPNNGQVTRYLFDPDDPSSISSNSISSLAEGPGSALWVASPANGLSRLDRRSGKFTRFQNDPGDPHSLSSDNVLKVYADRQGVVWAGMADGGLDRYVEADGQFVHYVYDPTDPTSLSHNWVFTMFEDRWGRFWVGTHGGGLNLLDRQTGRFTRFMHDALDPSSLSDNSVLSIYEDRAGVLWFGTFGSGLDKHDPYQNKFLLLQSKPEDPQSLSSNEIWSIYEDRQGIVWIGTGSGGLNRFDPQTGTWQHYLTDPVDPDSLSSDTVFSILQDKEERLWIGTNNGLNRLEPQDGKFIKAGPQALIFSLYEDHLGLFWLGTSQGLTLFDRESNEFQTFQEQPGDPSSLSNNAVLTIQEDRLGNLWVGTFAGGLNRYNRETKRFTRYVHDPKDATSLSSNTVLSIHPTQDGELWIGTSGGLNRLNPENGEMVAFREKDGLPNNVIYGILEDRHGNLWLSTNLGLSRFDPQVRTFKNYAPSDGLQGPEFNQGAYYQNQDEVLFFGGVNGLNIFSPEEIVAKPYVPPVVITDFLIYNRPVQPGPDSPLKQPIESTRELQLAYSDSFFEFEYAALDYSAPQKIQYAYRMENLDRDWNEVGNRRFATYTNIPPGEYIFRVKSTNSDGVWDEYGTAIKIVIPPPFWQTWWFRVLALVALVGSAALVIALRLNAIEKQRQQLEILVDQRTRQLHDTMVELEKSKEAAEASSRAKSIFLANMSHEFRTPLNAILGFTQIMTRDRHLPPEQQENLQIIYRSSEHLLGLINDVLEMSKIEAGRTELNKRSFDLVRMLQGLAEMFSLRAESKDISLNVVISPNVPRFVDGDEGKLRQVLMNLLGNAVKFTHQGHVILRVHPRVSAPMPTGQDEDNAWIVFEVEDTGPGISLEEIDQMFMPFIQTSSGQRAQEGTGLGLTISQQYVRLMGGEIRVASELGKGSTFTFEIPLGTIERPGGDSLESPRHPIGLQPGQPIYRMLVVDDQEVNRLLLCRLLSPLGFEVQEAVNGQEALRIWELWQPHLIWMDMRMPVMDGYTATRRIKATTLGQATIVIALTASSLEEDRAIILSEGCDDYMRKPFREEDLFAIIVKHLGVRYIYEDLPPAGDQAGLTLLGAMEQPSPEPDQEEEKLLKRLGAAQPEWLAGLEEATVLGDLEAITGWIDSISRQDPSLAEGILGLASNYDHDKILSLIKRSHRPPGRDPEENGAWHEPAEG